ncbi:hypothetical protein E2C01_007252 [Portunus trituberculatus]|uniref:Uncharacterized protein n=1 Tax=Portunus trituberculatus TaxID=210409 RepID=A0A5B7CZL9_PORTR|nr:hypothetical protein [Portunus trituberculatus]
MARGEDVLVECDFQQGMTPTACCRKGRGGARVEGRTWQGRAGQGRAGQARPAAASAAVHHNH